MQPNSCEQVGQGMGAIVKSRRSEGSYLNRYTSLPIVLDMLEHRRLALLSPETWQDRNDAHYLERYREDRKIDSVLAVCFSRSRETYHHWSIYAGGASGVCVEFDRQQLLESIPATGYRHGAVRYRRIDKLELKNPSIKWWPFLKRKPFRDELEYRIIYEGETAHERVHYIPIKLSWINKVTLSPWLPEAVENCVIDSIRRIDGCSGLNVFRSTLINNARWRAVIDKPAAVKANG